jgi:hypothetical protein
VAWEFLFAVLGCLVERETRLELATSSLEVTRWYLNSGSEKSRVGALDSAFRSPYAPHSARVVEQMVNVPS